MAYTATVTGVGVSVDEEGVGAPIVVLEAGDQYLPIFISPDQAQSMELVRRGLPFNRPLTHDLMVDMMTDFGGAIDRVRIDDLRDGTFYAKIDAERYEGGEREEFIFDARPSDAIALSLRIECPIEVDEHVMALAGQSPDEIDLEGIDLDSDDEVSW